MMFVLGNSLTSYLSPVNVCGAFAFVNNATSIIQFFSTLKLKLNYHYSTPVP